VIPTWLSIEVIFIYSLLWEIWRGNLKPILTVVQYYSITYLWYQMQWWSLSVFGREALLLVWPVYDTCYLCHDWLSDRTVGRMTWCWESRGWWQRGWGWPLILSTEILAANQSKKQSVINDWNRSKSAGETEGWRNLRNDRGVAEAGGWNGSWLAGLAEISTGLERGAKAQINGSSMA